MRGDPDSEPRADTALQTDEAGELREQLLAERRVAELSRRLLALDFDEVADSIQDALGAAARGAGADRAQLVWTKRDAGGEVSLERNLWAAPGVEPIVAEDDDVSLQSYAWSRRRLLAGEVIHVPSVEDLPLEAAAERESLLDQGNRSYLVIPLLTRGRFTGCLDVRRVRSTRGWTPAEIEGIRLIGEVLCSVLRRQDANDEKRESADRFRAIAENLQVTLTESTPDGALLYASPRMADLLGYSHDEIQSLVLEDLVHPEDRGTRLQIYAPNGGDDSGREAVFRARHRDGSWRSIQAQGHSYETRSGERRFVSLLRDVTEEHERNVQLQLRLDLETLISSLSRRFLSSEAGEIEDLIREGLQSVARAGGADRTFLMSLPELRTGQPYFFEWCSAGIPPRSSSPDDGDARRFRGFSSALLAGEVIRVPVVAEMPDTQAKEREAMLQAGIRSYLLVPAVSRGKLVAILCLHCIRQERRWSENDVTLLQLAADLFSSALRRKRSETALSESEARFRALAENSRDSICELSPEGSILYASPAWAQLVGSARSELEGRNLVELARAEDRDLLADFVESAGSGLASGAISFQTRHPDGRWLDIEATAGGFATALGEPRLVTVLRDVTERERDHRILERQISGEQRIAELSRFFMDLEPGSTQQATQEKLAVAAEIARAERAWMFTLDPRGLDEHRHYTWVPSDADSREAALPDRTEALAWARSDELPEREVNISRVAALAQGARAEHTSLTRRNVRSFLAVPLLSGGSLIGLMAFEVISRECTWSPEEVTLLRLVGEVFVSALRREQAEVQLERSQNQLLQSQKMEAVGTLAGGIAHDFNNHLAVMLGNAGFLAGETEGNEEAREALDDLQRSAEHCAQLTRSLLAFSRRSPVTIQVIHVQEVMATVSELVRPLLPSPILLDVRPADPGHAVRADPTQLRQVFINLLVNARDAMPDGGRLTLASCERRVETQEAWARGLPSAGRYVEISVADDGDGMSEAIRSRIFEPFFTTKRLGEGTGLGLATAYGIIQQCRGAITVDSELGRGATFRVVLPLCDDSPRRLEPATLLAPGSGSETLLLVEDEPAVRRLLARMLRKTGYRVLEAEDGLAALALAGEAGQEIDLLVTDLVMPRMGGAEVASKLQAQRPDLRVLLLSGHAEPQDASPESEIRNARFLQKPFLDEALLREVRFLLDGG